MLRGKFWIKPNGEIIDCSDTEHAVVARNFIFGWDKTTPDKCIGPLTAAERGASKIPMFHHSELIRQLAREKNGDPRMVMLNQGWIRTRQNAIWAARWTRDMVDWFLTKHFFWKAQSDVQETDALDFYSLASEKVVSYTVRQLKRGEDCYDKSGLLVKPDAGNSGAVRSGTRHRRPSRHAKSA